MLELATRIYFPYEILYGCRPGPLRQVALAVLFFLTTKVSETDLSTSTGRSKGLEVSPRRTYRFISYENRLLQIRTVQRTSFLSVKLNFALAIPLICLPRAINVCQDCQPYPARLAKPGRTILIPNATSLQDRTGLLGIIFAEKGVRPYFQQRSKVKSGEL